MNVARMNERMAEIDMTPSQLIRKAGISESTMRRIRLGCTDVRVSTIRMIADALDIDVRELIDTEKSAPAAFDPEKAAEVSEAALEMISVVAEGQTIVIKRDLDIMPPEGAPDSTSPDSPEASEIVMKTREDAIETMLQLIESYKERLLETRGNCDKALALLEQAYTAHTVVLKRLSILLGITAVILAVLVVALIVYNLSMH